MAHLTIRTLEDIEIGRILDCFNISLSDYYIPVKLNLSQLKNKIKSEDICMEYSIGAFDGEKLVGFILHGYDILQNKKTLYNAATGVLPGYRGRKITAGMYNYGLPMFEKEGIHAILLEVISSHHAAVRTYKQAGFEVIRNVISYRGAIQISPESDRLSTYIIRETDACEWSDLGKFWDFRPTWQNSLNTIIRNKEYLRIWYIFKGYEEIGYLIYNPNRKRVHLFAIDPAFRRQGAASALFSYVTKEYEPEVSVINVDADNVPTNAFLQSIGLSRYLEQYEMKLVIKP